MGYTNELVVDCLQYERAFCTAECPFNLDIRDFIGKLQQGRFNVAYKTYQNVVGFPGIVTALCSEPCKQACPLKDNGGSISLKLLEKAALDFARNSDPDQYNMPQKDKMIAIIGAGISGLACALRLTTKKYNVTVFERSESIGGHLHQILSPEIFLQDIEKQFKYEAYTLKLNTEILNLDDLNFDAIYIATGKGGNSFGISLNNEDESAILMPGVFIGGSITGADTMHAIAQGLNVSVAIEKYLKVGFMSHPDENDKGTKLIKDAIRIIPNEVLLPSNKISYSKDEAIAEAKRCLKCTCDACVHYSPLMSYFEKFPKRITEEVEITINPSSLDGNATMATRLISTCNHCGLCKEVCPKNIDTGEFLLKSHRTMREKGKMPWAFHDYYLRDMDFSNNEASLTKLPKGHDKSRYFFFPGCQLGASNPQYVIKSYKFLTEQFNDTALMLNCCGAPAEWAGDEPIHSKVIEKIKSDWIKLGKPKAIFACPTCKQMFKQYLPEIEGEFLYDFIDEKGVNQAENYNNEIISIFDPCASRNEPELQQKIRRLAKKAGLTLEPLQMEGKMAECCSYGGQVSIAHPPYASHVVHNRISQNENPYITYCSNCRDIFSAAGKKTWHILDILFNFGSDDRILPTITERRINRLQLKQILLQEFWMEGENMEKPEYEFYILPELKEKLNNKFILETDIYSVIVNCEKSGMKLFDPDAETYTGHMQIGNMTYWVEYRKNDSSGFELVNAYCHRMKIEEK
jgi:Fe-S oxidoreductase